MKKKLNKFISGIIALLLALTVFPKSSSVYADGVKEITIPSYKTGQNVGAELFLGQIERFNKKHEGKYKINVEEIPQDAYGEQIKQLALQDNLPAIIHNPGSGSVDVQWFEDVIVANDLYYDLSEFLDEHEDIKSNAIDEIVEFNTRDGKVITLPDYKVRPPFLYYNEDLYSPEKPIAEMSLDEFKESLGDNKIAFMTGENVWTTGLFWTAIIANEEGGPELLQQYSTGELTDITDPIFVSSIEKLADFMNNHGSANTLGAIYADAANAFMSEEATFIANGPWMTVDFQPDSSDKWSNDFDGSKVRADYFPGKVGLSSYEVYGDWIPANVSEDDLEVALAWFEFLYTPEEIENTLLTEGGQTPNYEPSEDFLDKLKENKPLYDIQESTDDEVVFVPSILDILPSSVADNDLSRFLPQLLNGDLTAEEFAEAITQAAKQAKSE